MNLKSNKSPGIDDISAHLYHIYWNTIKSEFIQVIDDFFSNNEMSTSQYRGVITLMYKKREHENFANGRPLTLLTSDYKILAKVSSERIKPLLHSDQKGFIKVRNIEDVIRLLSDVIEYTGQMNMGGAINFLDQQKAFNGLNGNG